MAKHSVKYECGHWGEIECSNKNRDYAVSREAEKICPDCWRKARKEENQRLYKHKLIGSEKQVNWACDIIAQYVSESRWVEIMNQGQKENMTQEEAPIVSVLYDFLEWLTCENKNESQYSKAKWWIDNRDDAYAYASPITLYQHLQRK